MTEEAGARPAAREATAARRTSRAGRAVSSSIAGPLSWLCLLLGGPGCVPAQRAASAPVRATAEDVRSLPLRPPLAVVVRDGDPRAALAVAVLTAGIDDEAGPRMPVALAAITEARLAAEGVRDVTVAATWDGFRVRALLPAGHDGAPVLRALREALLTPIAAGAPELDAVQRKLATLARRPLHDPALLEAARCKDEPLSLDRPDAPAPPAATLERWRAASDGLGRVVFGVTGTAHDVDTVASALLDQPAWPAASLRPAHPPLPAREERATRVYDATADIPPGSARFTVVVDTSRPDVAIAAARALGARNSALAVRLRDLDAGVALRDITATARAGGGCLTVTLDVPRADESARSTLAGAVVIVRQEARQSVGGGVPHASSVRPAVAADDPREAAELAAWWALVETATDGAPRDSATDSVIVGLGAGNAAPGDFAARAAALSSDLERTYEASQKLVVDARREVERGQGALWLLLASPCGTLAEGDADAGLTALAVASLALQARSAARERDADLEEWVTSEGAGLVVRAARHDGESPAALARRAADVLGAALMAGAVEPATIGRARAQLMGVAGKDDDARAFAVLASALTPGHPSWTFPLAAGGGLEAWSDGAVASRVAALRHGPLRVAILGTEDDAQVDAAIQAVDRWVSHAPGSARSCPPSAAPPAARAGTYAAPPAAAHSAWVAVPLARGPSGRDARDAALAAAAALDGPDGLLARALSSGLATSWSAKVVGPREASALVVYVRAAGHTLDAAVAQVRSLLDRLRRGAFTRRTAHARRLASRRSTSRARSDRAGASLASGAANPWRRPCRPSRRSGRSSPTASATTGW